MTDPIADMLTRIRNANRALLPEVRIPHSKLKERIVHILKREGYIADFQLDDPPAKAIRVRLKFQGKKGVIHGIQRVSRPGLRRYVGSAEIPRVLGGLGTAIVSTPQGVMSGVEAGRHNVGGELICYVW